MLLLDLSHTSHTRARTGIQQVARRLYWELREQDETEAIVYDPYWKQWRKARGRELRQLLPTEAGKPGSKRGANWTSWEKLNGFVRRWTGSEPRLPGAGIVVFPEFILQRCIEAFPQLRDKTNGRFLALFHDAIALKMPHLAAPQTVARSPAYLKALRSMDGVAAISEASKHDLVEFWKWSEPGKKMPPVTVIPLAVSTPSRKGIHQNESADRPRVLCVGTFEARKNQSALLDAAEMLWAEGLQFELEFVGMARRDSTLPRRIGSLSANGRPLRWLGPVSDDELEAAYARCTFTCYPSLMEGFGLPVLESLVRGKPCVCTTCGGLAEVAAGGGCLTIADTSAVAIAEGLRRMLSDEALRERLQAEAEKRLVRTWNDYAGDVKAWAETFR